MRDLKLYLTADSVKKEKKRKENKESSTEHRLRYIIDRTRLEMCQSLNAGKEQTPRTIDHDH